VSGNGVECGGHTHTHVPLDLISEKLAFGEITRCKQELEQHLQRPINTFAYPSGYYNGNVQDQVIQAGFSNACAVKNALSHTGDDVYALARVCITPNMSLADFERVTLGRSPRLVPRKERLRTKLWRQTRRLLMRFDK
jgi:peptidoglycan/xylan/chitin deacetylase (PgdA/CDA1 family)